MNKFEEKWMEKYNELKEYKEKNGHINLEKHSKLCEWLRAQKYAYKGKRGRLTDYQIKLLEDLGVEWTSRRERKWLDFYAQAKKYYETHLNLNIPMSYVDKDGYDLGRWVAYQRKAYRCIKKEMKHKPLITNDEIELLEKIGMHWDITWLGKNVSIPEYLVYYYILMEYDDAIKLNAADFLKREIDIYIPSIKLGIEYDGYIWHKDEVKVLADEKKGEICKKKGVKLIRIREKGLCELENCDKCYFVEAYNWEDLEKVIEDILFTITEKRIVCDVSKDYSKIIENYMNYRDHKWDLIYESLLKRYNIYGEVKIEINETNKEGINLYNWLSKQRSEFQNGTMTKSHKLKLTNLGITLNSSDDAWDNWIKLLKDYKNQFGNINVKIDYVTNGGDALGKWLSHQRNYNKKNQLLPERKKLLEEMGIDWTPRLSHEEMCIRGLREYFERNGNICLPKHYTYNGINLWEWCQGKKKQKKKNSSIEVIRFLEEMDFVWDEFDKRWNEYYVAVLNYYNENGNIFLPVHYKSDEGKDLWEWLSKQRVKYAKKKLSQNQIGKLEHIGIIWDTYEFKWMQKYNILLDYYKKYGNIDIPVNCIYKGVNLGMWLSTQRQAYRGNPNYSINQKRIEFLNTLGMKWKEENNTRNYR